MRQTVTAKLSHMAKAQVFIVEPLAPNADDYEKQFITIRSHRSIGFFHRETGRGYLNWRGGKHYYHSHLATALGAEEYQFPADFVQACIDALPQPGDEIASGFFIPTGKERVYDHNNESQHIRPGDRPRLRLETRPRLN